MFNVGPLELMVLAIVGLVVLGPERLPSLAKDAARLIRTLRDLATGAREQLRDELGPEFADVDLRNLNPRTALQRAVLGDDFDLTKYDPRRFDARSAANDLVFGSDPGADGPGSAAEPVKPVTFDKGAANGHPNGATANGAAPRVDRPRPRPRPRPSATPYDDDAT